MKVLKNFYFHILNINQGCLSHYALAIYIKEYFKGKEESWKFKYFNISYILIQ
jgi:hypothetical protein